MRTLGRIVWLLILIPIAIALMALAVANRHNVALVLDPFSPSDPSLALQAPLFLLLFVAVLVGVVLGGVATWLGQGKWRKTARRRGQEAARWHGEADRLARQMEAAARPQLTSAAD
jgi:uncharacterized integral membrane protein